MASRELFNKMSHPDVPNTSNLSAFGSSDPNASITQASRPPTCTPFLSPPAPLFCPPEEEGFLRGGGGGGGGPPLAPLFRTPVSPLALNLPPLEPLSSSLSKITKARILRDSGYWLVKRRKVVEEAAELHQMVVEAELNQVVAAKLNEEVYPTQAHGMSAEQADKPFAREEAPGKWWWEDKQPCTCCNFRRSSGKRCSYKPILTKTEYCPGSEEQSQGPPVPVEVNFEPKGKVRRRSYLFNV